MKQCPMIVDIKFDEKSLEGIEYIKNVHNGTQILRFAVMMGHLYSIFGGSSLRSIQNSGVSGVMNLIPNQTVKTVTQKVGDVVVSEATQTAYSITNANWEYFYKSFDSLDKIKRGRIEKVAGFQVLAHLTSPKERLFWRAVEKGCSIK